MRAKTKPDVIIRNTCERKIAEIYLFNDGRVLFIEHGYPVAKVARRQTIGEDVEDWLDNYDRVSSANRWDEGMKLRHVSFYLPGVAKTTFGKLAHA